MPTLRRGLANDKLLWREPTFKTKIDDVHRVGMKVASMSLPSEYACRYLNVKLRSATTRRWQGIPCQSYGSSLFSAKLNIVNKNNLKTAFVRLLIIHIRFTLRLIFLKHDAVNNSNIWLSVHLKICRPLLCFKHVITVKIKTLKIVVLIFLVV